MGERIYIFTHILLWLTVYTHVNFHVSFAFPLRHCCYAIATTPQLYEYMKFVVPRSTTEYSYHCRLQLPPLYIYIHYIPPLYIYH